MVPETEGLFPKKKRFLVYGTVIVVSLLAILLGLSSVYKILDDPGIPLLVAEHGADWIRFREPPQLRSRRSQILTTYFRTVFDVQRETPQAILTLRSMKRAIVRLDGRVIFMSDAKIEEWKREFYVVIPSGLNPGRHELNITIFNEDGHPTLIAHCMPLGIVTGEHWEATDDGKNWKPALSVHSHQHPVECRQIINENNMEKGPPLPMKFQRADEALVSNAPVFLSIFVAVFMLSFFSSRNKRPAWLKFPLITAGRVRWIVWIAWIGLAVNNIAKIPPYAGMDAGSHFEYIKYVAIHWRIPLATEGWQMFQPPLYYFLSALLYKVLVPVFSLENVFVLLRMVPLACGAFQAEICWRTLRYVFPDRDDLQIVGTLLGGLLPMNLYISQVIGNEPLAGCLSGMVVFLVIRYLKSPILKPWRALALIGLFLGSAMLTKVTAILLLPPALFVVAYKDLAEQGSVRGKTGQAFLHIGIIFGVAFLVSGWYYIRNYIEMGWFFIGGWDASRNILWWQDPSYRTLQHFFAFGESLFYPVYSAVAGIWDSLYSTLWMDGLLSGICAYDTRPPWNYDFMLANAWLSILPSIAIGIGVLKSIMNPLRETQRISFFCTLCLGIYLSAILYLFLTVPIYSTGKATYALGLVSCFAVLCAEGFNLWTRRPLLQATAYGILACWAVSSYCAYFVL